MPKLETLDTSILSLIILLFMCINAYNRSERAFMHYRLFMALLLTNMAMIGIDIFGWIFNGLPGRENFLSNQYANLALYVFEPIAPMLWVLYTNYQVNRDQAKTTSLAYKLLVLVGANAIFSFISLYTGWFFSVDNQNIYHRGPYFWIHVTFCYCLVVYAFMFVLRNRTSLEKRHFFSLLLFFVPVSIGTVIQFFHYGVSYNWSGMMLSLLIVYFSIQNRGLNTDYLTGLYNRRQLDSHIKAKIRNSGDGSSFSAILIDLNDFKSINDRFGHDIGDEALKDAVQIISCSLRKDDFVARYGGDEFMIIMDVANYKALEQAVRRIELNIERFNKNGNKSYVIDLTMGYAVYEPRSKMTADEFFRYIDQLMYDAKKSGPQ